MLFFPSLFIVFRNRKRTISRELLYREYSSYTFLHPRDKSFRTIQFSSKYKTDRWGCSLSQYLKVIRKFSLFCRATDWTALNYISCFTKLLLFKCLNNSKWKIIKTLPDSNDFAYAETNSSDLSYKYSSYSFIQSSSIHIDSSTNRQTKSGDTGIYTIFLLQTSDGYR